MKSFCLQVFQQLLDFCRIEGQCFIVYLVTEIFFDSF